MSSPSPSSSEPLFPASLIAADVHASFPAGYTVRSLARDDYAKGFFDCLAVLSSPGAVSEAQFLARYDWIAARARDVQYHVVIEHEGRVVGTGAVMVERKFIHDLGLCGHVEEIAIRKEYQAQGLGKKLLASLTSIAKNVGCYKSTLGCSERNRPFYEKCGYEDRHSCIMSEYYEDVKEPYYRG